MNYEHLTATIAGAFRKLAEKRSYREKRAARFLSPKYASKILCRWLYLYLPIRLNKQADNKVFHS
jgi:hypothetical protein